MDPGRVQAEQHPIPWSHDVEARVGRKLVVARGSFGKREREEAQVRVHTMRDSRHLDEAEFLQTWRRGHDEASANTNRRRGAVQHRSGSQSAIRIEQGGRSVKL